MKRKRKKMKEEEEKMKNEEEKMKEEGGDNKITSKEIETMNKVAEEERRRKT